MINKCCVVVEPYGVKSASAKERAHIKKSPLHLYAHSLVGDACGGPAVLPSDPLDPEDPRILLTLASSYFQIFLLLCSPPPRSVFCGPPPRRASGPAATLAGSTVVTCSHAPPSLPRAPHIQAPLERFRATSGHLTPAASTGTRAPSLLATPCMATRVLAHCKSRTGRRRPFPIHD